MLDSRRRMYDKGVYQDVVEPKARYELALDL